MKTKFYLIDWHKKYAELQYWLQLFEKVTQGLSSLPVVHLRIIHFIEKLATSKKKHYKPLLSYKKLKALINV